MPEPDLFALFVEPLNQLGTRYLISGSVAAMLYGEPRITHDIDLVVSLQAEDVPGLARVFPQPEFYVPPTETILTEMSRERRGHFNIIHINSGLKADFYTANRDELHTWAFRHRRHYEFRGVSIALAPPEYVILRKLEYHREGGSEKHLRDIRARLAISGDQIDGSALNQWVQQLGVGTEWQRVIG